MISKVYRNVIVALLVSAFVFSITGCGGGDDGLVSNTDTTPNIAPGGDIDSGGGNEPPTTSSATLTWTPPLTHTDGSALTDLAGYRIYYGTTSGNYSSVITLNNPGLSEYVIDNLPSNTYYMVITAVDSSGIESTYSNEVSKSI